MSCPNCKDKDIIRFQGDWVLDTDDGLSPPVIKFCPFCGVKLALSSKWISTDDKLPPNDDEVWAYDAHDCYVVVATYRERYSGWSHVHGDDDGLGDERLYEVTHWMPLERPEKPLVKELSQ